MLHSLDSSQLRCRRIQNHVVLLVCKSLAVTLITVLYDPLCAERSASCVVVSHSFCQALFQHPARLAYGTRFAVILSVI